MPFQKLQTIYLIISDMPQQKFYQSSISTLRYPNYMTQSLTRLELRKPLFLCGESRVQEYPKSRPRLYTDYKDIETNNLSEQCRQKLIRIQANPFLKSYRIYPKIPDCGLFPKLQKIQIHQKSKYITKRQESLYKRFHTFGDDSPSKRQENQQIYNEEAEKFAADILRRQMDWRANNEKQPPVKEEGRSGNRNYTDYQKNGHNNYSRYQQQKGQKPQQIFYSQINKKEEWDKQHYMTNLFPPSFKKIEEQNQTIIHKLQQNNIHEESEVDKLLVNQKDFLGGLRNTGAFGQSPIQQGDIFGVIQQIHQQGQSNRQKYKTKDTYPDEIKVRGTTYFSVKTS